MQLVGVAAVCEFLPLSSDGQRRKQKGEICTSYCLSSHGSLPASALSPALTAVLYDLSRQIPQLKKDIQDGLLKMLSLVLMHKPLRHPGMPKGLAHQLASPSLTNIPEASDVGSITLALRTLGSFEFEGKMKKQRSRGVGCKH